MISFFEVSKTSKKTPSRQSVLTNFVPELALRNFVIIFKKKRTDTTCILDKKGPGKGQGHKNAKFYRAISNSSKTNFGTFKMVN